MMKQLGYDIEAAHCNFHLRGKESDRDEEFCKTLTNNLDIKIHLIHFDTIEYSKLHKESIELAARNLRYNYFAQLCRDIDAAAVLVAHHRDDSVETILMNLLRGTGIDGLCGIQPKRTVDVRGVPLTIIRPLLCIGRKDIEQWLQEQKQDYVNDSTNFEDDVMRNKIRLNLLPVIDSINPNARQNILLTANNLRHVIENTGEEYELFRKLSTLGFSGKQIEQIYANKENTGATFASSTHDVVITSNGIKVERHCEPIKDMVIPETGNYIICRRTEDDGTERMMRLRISMSDTVKIHKDPFVASLDADKVQFPLTLRSLRTGDKFAPFGMKGSKLISDYLTDSKVDLLDRRKQLVVEDASGKIIWLLGRRTSNLCKIDDSTKRMLVITYEEE